MRLLIANANTSPEVTRLCADAAGGVASPGTEIVALTGRFGARIITGPAEIAIAAHALLDMLAPHAEGADAALVAVSYDPGLDAARDLFPFPVIGMTQAALVTASLVGTRIGMVTFGTPEIYRDIAKRYGLAEFLAGIAVVQVSPEQAYATPEAIVDSVAATANELIRDHGADVIALCGAALAGMSGRLGVRVSVPVVDGITAGVPLCEALARLPRRPSPSPAEKPSVGLSPALTRLLQRG